MATFNLSTELPQQIRLNQFPIHSDTETLTTDNFSVTSTEVLIEWKISDFLSEINRKYMEGPNGNIINSKKFSFSNSTWFIKLCISPSSNTLMLSLKLESTTEYKSVEFNFNLKKPNGKMFIENNSRYRHRVFHANNTFFEATNLVTLKELRDKENEFLASGTLTVICYMKDSSMSCVKDILQFKAKTAMESEKYTNLEALSSNLKDLFINKRKCDIIIKVNGQLFQAHKALLVARSSVFADMIGLDTSEEKSELVTLPDCDPDSFEVFLKFLYTGKIEDLTFLNARHLYVTADEHDIQDLKSFCGDYMMDHLTVDNVCDAVNFAEQYENVALMSAAQFFFNQNADLIVKTGEWKTMMTKKFSLGNKLLVNMLESKYCRPSENVHSPQLFQIRE